MRKYVLGILSALLASSTAPAQPKPGQVQPDRLPLGVLRVGAIAEASLRIFVEGDDPKGLVPNIKAPAAVKVLKEHVGVENFGKEDIIVYDVVLAIDTAKAIKLSGDLEVEVGKQRVRIPISVQVRQPEPGLTRILIVESPFDKYSTSDASLFYAWLGVAASAKLDPQYLLTDDKKPVLRDIDLSKIDVVVMAESGLFHAQETDRKRLTEFVKKGGRLVVSADAFYRGSVAKANELVAPFGLRMVDDEPRGLNDFEVGGEDIAKDPLTKGIERLRLRRFSPTAITDKKKAKVLVAAPTYPDQGLVAVARLEGGGEVITLGNSLWWAWIGRTENQESDNARLWQNLVTRPRPQK